MQYGGAMARTPVDPRALDKRPDVKDTGAHNGPQTHRWSPWAFGSDCKGCPPSSRKNGGDAVDGVRVVCILG